MSIEDYAKSLLAEAGITPATKAGGKPDEPTPDGKPLSQSTKPEPNQPDPEEVQYPGYFKGCGSL